jgi:pimeloyl-ACP methyl ester carboxylesterase
MQVVVDGLAINYQKEGQGNTLLLIHGWNDNSNGLKILRNELKKHYQVITPDLPGFGASEAPRQDWGLTEYVNFLVNFLSKVTVNRPYALIGHSNGGAIAIKAISAGSLNPEKLILLSSAGIRGKHKGKMTAIKLTTKAGKLILSPLPKSLKLKARKKLYHQIGSDMLVAEHMSGSFKKIVSEDIQSDAAKLDLPTLLIYGEEDNQTPIAYGELFHQLIDHSTFEVIADSGHFVHLDSPKVVVNLIEDYLK